MKTQIAILGSTGSIGKSFLKLIKKNKKEIEIILLTANKNYKCLLKQTKEFTVKNVIISDKKSFINFNKLNQNKKIRVYNNFNSFNKIFNKKIDYVMSSIVGLNGLSPTVKVIKFTKKIAIANKESIICAWDIINKNLIKYNTKFVPVDSEHFSLWYATKCNSHQNIHKVYLTASGGSLLNFSKKKIKTLKLNQILKHPNWNMGKKITIDSSTLMNKVFEIIEAKNIFQLDYKQLNIILHPSSYIHAIVKFKDGMIKIIAHDTTMDIPIFNSFYAFEKSIKTKSINFKKLNNLNFKKIDEKKFPFVKILNSLPKKNTLFETALVTINDELVNLFLEKKIKYHQISSNLFKIINLSDINKLKKILPTKVSDVISTSTYVRKKINSLNLKMT